MRCFVFAGLLALSGCVQAEAVKPKVIVKTVIVEKPVTAQSRSPEVIKVYTDKCPPPAELSKHCNAIGNRTDCDAEQRCQWAEGEQRGPYCRRLHCKPEGKPWPRNG